MSVRPSICPSVHLSSWPSVRQCVVRSFVQSTEAQRGRGLPLPPDPPPQKTDGPLYGSAWISADQCGSARISVDHAWSTTHNYPESLRQTNMFTPNKIAKRFFGHRPCLSPRSSTAVDKFVDSASASPADDRGQVHRRTYVPDGFCKSPLPVTF